MRFHHPQRPEPGSITFYEAKLIIQVYDPDTSLIGNDAHKALADVANLIVLVQKLDVPRHRCLGVWVPT